jgi:ATP-dependent protease HslVU (ClpYQ) peptidase subunit
MKQKIIVNFAGNAIAGMAFDAILDKVSDEKFRLLDLMRESAYEFKNKKYTSRMLNHYEHNGWVIADRNNPIGKRKFSLFGMLFLNLNVKFYGSLAKYNLNSKDNYEVLRNEFDFATSITGELITPFEMICLIAISLHRVAFIDPQITSKKNDVILTFSPDNRGHYDFSANIFDYLGDWSRTKKQSSKVKTSYTKDEFLVWFVYFIDQIRSKIGVNLLLPELYNNLRGKDVIHVNQSHRNIVANTNLFTLGEALMSHIFDSNRRLVKDEDGYCYAVNVKYLGKQNLIKKLVGERKIEKLSDVVKPDLEH